MPNIYFKRSKGFIDEYKVDIDINFDDPKPSLHTNFSNQRHKTGLTTEELCLDLLKLEYAEYELLTTVKHDQFVTSWERKIAMISAILKSGDENQILQYQLGLNPDIRIVKMKYQWDSFDYYSKEFITNMGEKTDSCLYFLRPSVFGYIYEKMLKGWETLLWQIQNNGEITGNEILLLLNSGISVEKVISQKVIHFIAQMIVYHNALNISSKEYPHENQ